MSNKKTIFLIPLLIFIPNIYSNFLVFDFGNNHLEIEQKSELKSSQKTSSNNGFIVSHNYKLFWFIHISDTQFIWYNNSKISEFYQFLNETNKEISPLFIYHTGDIVQADFSFGQDKIEWERYKNALFENNINASNYMDVIGNHDAIRDPNSIYFLNYSIMGQFFNTTQYSFNKSFTFGNYAFIGLNTAKSSYTLLEYSFQGFLSSNELDWYEKELEKYKDFDKIFVFGHHPPSYPLFYHIKSENSSSGKDFNELNDEYNVPFYFSGHVHENSVRYFNELLTITTANFDKEGGTYRIIALDNNRLSTSIEYVGRWPQGIITHPQSESNQRIDKIRVLAWDPQGISSIKWSINDIEKELQITDWKPLINVNSNEPLWEGDLAFHSKGKYKLKVKVEGGSGEVIKEIILNLKSEWELTVFIIFTFIIITLISTSIITFNYLRIYIEKPKKIKKRHIDLA
ncbi:MAG: metallophosphoesterase family protein [Promethearchaeota archaeon]